MFDAQLSDQGGSQNRQQQGPRQQETARKRWFGEKIKDKLSKSYI